MKKAYNSYSITFKYTRIPDGYFVGERNELYIKIYKLMEEKIFSKRDVSFLSIDNKILNKMPAYF